MHMRHQGSHQAGTETTGSRHDGFGRRVGLAGVAGLVTTVGAAGLAAGPAGASSRPTVVKAVETDFHIALSKSSFAPGRYTFVAINKGQTTHALEITGPGLSGATTKDIVPGQSTKLTVTFKKGAYDVFCPVPGHKMLGMNVNLTVGSASAAATATHSSHTTTTAKSSGGYGY